MKNLILQILRCSSLSLGYWVFKGKKLAVFLLQIIVFCTLQLFMMSAYARSEDIGHVAQNLMSPVTLFSDLIQTGCFIIGGSFLFASIIKYFEHKRSPLMTPMSTVVFLFIAGLILVLLPFLSYFIDGGVQYSLMK